ncbi:MAG TPA: hypothetical protein VFU88_00605 [Ktedonobacterales bacterium]|nr:hypothetical protein [Ktedonobacterales bacterium]
MIFTTVRVERPEGTVLLRGIAVQIEQAAAEDRERLDFAGARPVDLFWVYTTQGVPAVPLRRRDVLFDEVNIDPETGQLAKYRVAGLVETFDAHQEALCERVIGG